jgi:hypothetical protein
MKALREVRPLLAPLEWASAAAAAEVAKRGMVVQVLKEWSEVVVVTRSAKKC